MALTLEQVVERRDVAYVVVYDQHSQRTGNASLAKVRGWQDKRRFLRQLRFDAIAGTRPSRPQASVPAKRITSSG